MGIRLPIDNFGTGYSSLSHLRQFPVDILKIDKSFVDPLTDENSEGTAFVKTIISLARDLHLSTVAEGIESATNAKCSPHWAATAPKASYSPAPSAPPRLRTSPRRRCSTAPSNGPPAARADWN